MHIEYWTNATARQLNVAIKVDTSKHGTELSLFKNGRRVNVDIMNQYTQALTTMLRSNYRDIEPDKLINIRGDKIIVKIA